MSDARKESQHEQSARARGGADLEAEGHQADGLIGADGRELRELLADLCFRHEEGKGEPIGCCLFTVVREGA